MRTVDAPSRATAAQRDLRHRPALVLDLTMLLPLWYPIRTVVEVRQT
jgi:hypothetical protein